MQAALGAVRCGECMKIFNANYHLVALPAEDLNAEEPSTEEAAPAPTTALNSAADQQQDSYIPTLHEHPPSAVSTELEHVAELDLHDDFNPITNPDTEADNAFNPAALVTDRHPDYSVATEHPQPKAAARLSQGQSFLAAGLALLLLLGGVSWWLWQPQAPANFAFSAIRLAPAAKDPNLLAIHFQMHNLSSVQQPTPDLTLELLNLSAQVISHTKIPAHQLGLGTSIQAQANHSLTLEVPRPATFVHSARLQSN